MDNDLTPLGRVIEEARGEMSKRAAARRAGISEGRWRQVVTGRQRAGGVDIPVNPRRETVIAMAEAVGVDRNEALSAAGFEPDPVRDAEYVAEPGPETDESAIERLILAKMTEMQQDIHAMRKRLAGVEKRLDADP